MNEMTQQGMIKLMLKADEYEGLLREAVDLMAVATDSLPADDEVAAAVDGLCDRIRKAVGR